MKLRWLACVIVWAATCAGQAADFPNQVLPEGVGVNIHFTRGHERDLDLIAAAGFKFIRMDFAWNSIERQKGQYDWAEYEDLTRNLEQRGLRPIFILDYSNGLYETNEAPHHPESVAAFARWAGASAQHFKGRRILWEIWNEPNIGFWTPKPNVHDYITLAKATCQAIRENDPQATIIAPASCQFPWDFFEEIFKSGLLSQMDAISVHPYRNYERGPETAAEDYLKLRSLIERYAPPDKKAMPILSGEWGYATHRQGVSLETQAAFIVRQQLANLLNGIPLSIWYDWKNDGLNPEDGEHNFGTVNNDLSPKPAYNAVQIMTRQLSGYRIAHRIDVGNPEAYVLLLVTPDGDQKLATWSTTGEQVVSLDTGLNKPGSIGIIDGKGMPQPVRLQEGRLQLSLTTLPAYVTFKDRSPALSIAAAWKVQEPYPRTVSAGGKNEVTLKLTIQNPFQHTVWADAKMILPGATVRKAVKVGQNKAADVTLTGGISRRDLSIIPVNLEVKMRDAAGKQIGCGAEQRLFQLANPMRLAVAPAQSALRVSIEKPGASFSGYLENGKQKRPITLNGATSAALVEFDQPATLTNTVVGPFNLTSKKRKLVAQIPAIKFQSIPVTNYQAALDGDGKIDASATLHNVVAPGENTPYARAFALEYQFADGWRFVRCEAGPAVRFDTRPTALGVWVYGDNSGNFLRVRLQDASGQTFQPTAGRLDWVGWRWVTFDLKDLREVAHWGGANDGLVKGGLTLDTAFLIDSTGRKTAGTIYFAGLTAIY